MAALECQFYWHLIPLSTKQLLYQTVRQGPPQELWSFVQAICPYTKTSRPLHFELLYFW